MTYIQHEDITRRDKALAWSVHLYTGSGALWGLLSILAAVESRYMLAFFWMAVTMFIDGVDGALARRFRVKTVTPNFDGALLDNIVDYFTYTIVPLVVVHMAGMVPANLLIGLTAIVTLTSAFQFCQVDAKTDDSNQFFFKGFPSYWNVVIMYLFILGTSQWVNFIVLILCCILVFVPVKYIYPSRTKFLRHITVPLSFAWTVMFIAALMLYPDAPRWLTWGSLLYIVYYVVASLYFTYILSQKTPLPQ